MLSTDGASDVVKNATRTMTEASATVKGLTGIDIPQLLNNALGGVATTEPPEQRPAARAVRWRRSSAASGGGGEGSGRRVGRWLGGVGVTAPAGRRPGAAAPQLRGQDAGRAERPPRPRRAASAAAAPTPEERLEAAANHRRRGGTGAPTPPADDARRPLVAAAAHAARQRPGPGDERRLAQAGLEAVGLDESSTLSDSAIRLAAELARVPGIERFGGTRLRDLDRSGPRSLRVLWGAARDELSTRYGDVTIGMLLDAYSGRRRLPRPPAGPLTAPRSPSALPDDLPRRSRRPACTFRARSGRRPRSSPSRRS